MNSALKTELGVRRHRLVQGRLRESAVVEPTAVQQAAIPAILSGKNVALQCYTGSGKVHSVNSAPVNAISSSVYSICTVNTVHVLICVALVAASAHK